jgi:hypothetical protein
VSYSNRIDAEQAMVTAGATAKGHDPTILAPTAGLLLVGCTALVLVGCSTLSTIRSQPPGATVYLNGANAGKTPVQVDLNDGFLPSAKYSVRLELEGYEAKTAPLGQDWNYGWIIFDVICFGALGGLIPAAFNGQSHRESYTFDLVPLGGRPPPATVSAPVRSHSSSSTPRVTSAAGSAPAHLNGTKIAVLPSQLEKSAKGQVPELFNDYVMAAVQEAGDFEVIGQEDINTLIGFENQKDLIDCSDTSCIADIGNALGVDRIMAVKVARLQTDWVITAKIINIKAARVESRVNEIVSGNVKNLLQAVPGVVANVFAQL